MSSGVHHPAVAKHDNVQRTIRSAALKHTLKGVFKKAKFESVSGSADSIRSGAESNYEYDYYQ